MDDVDYTKLDFILRLFGRIGFCILLITFYRLYTFFASPLTQQRHRKYIILFGVSVLVSFALLATNYLIPATWMSTISMSFNVLTTYIFATYLYYQGNILKQYHNTEEYNQLSRAMDAMILKLKAR